LHPLPPGSVPIHGGAAATPWWRPYTGDGGRRSIGATAALGADSSAIGASSTIGEAGVNGLAPAGSTPTAGATFSSGPITSRLIGSLALAGAGIPPAGGGMAVANSTRDQSAARTASAIPSNPGPGPPPGGVSTATGAPSGFGLSIFLTLAGLLMLGGPPAIGRLRLSSAPWLPSPFFLMPERPD
jgi:hypothetical protein